MNIVWEGILMFLLMAVILIFVVISLSGFFKPSGSLNSYKQFVSLVEGACTSPQSATNLQFNAPNAIIFQIYDNSTCDSSLSANQNTIFSDNSPYSSTLKNNFDLCYALPGPALSGDSIVSSARQYYLNATLSAMKAYYLMPIASTYNSANVIFLQYDNELDMPAMEVTANSSDIKDTAIEYYTSAAAVPLTFSPNTYLFNFYVYSNVSASMTINFINSGDICGSTQETLPQGYPQHFAVSSSCNTAFQDVGVVITTGGYAINYQINISATQYSEYTSNYATNILSQQCTALEPAFVTGLLKNKTLVCQPITCGSTTFQLTNALDRTFLETIGGTYSFLEVQSGLSSLQMINNNNEYITNETLFNILLSSIQPRPPYSDFYLCGRFHIDCAPV